MSHPDAIPWSDGRVGEAIELLSRIAGRPGADPDHLDAASEALDRLFAALGTEDVGELLAQAVERGALSEDQAAYALGVAPWCGGTNGAELQPRLERWLEEAADPLRIGLALAQPTFPFRDAGRMAEVLRTVTARHPQFSARCGELIASRAAQGT